MAKEKRRRNTIKNIFKINHVSSVGRRAILNHTVLHEKIAQYIRAKYGEDIANKLQNNMMVVLSAPTYSSATMTRYALRITLVRSQQATMSNAWLASHASLKAELVCNPNDQALITELTKLNNNI